MRLGKELEASIAKKVAEMERQHAADRQAAAAAQARSASVLRPGAKGPVQRATAALGDLRPPVHRLGLLRHMTPVLRATQRRAQPCRSAVLLRASLQARWQLFLL